MRFAIVDIETTGGSIATTKITEIAIYLHDGTTILDDYSSLVNPERNIPPFITRLTGISNEMVADAPKFYEIAKDIILFLEDTVFVAHNVGFDYNVLRQEYSSLGFDFRKHHFCTVRASRYVLPGHASYSLGKLTQALNIPLSNRHRAAGDALATAHLFTLIYQTCNGDVSRLIQHDINPKQLHPNLNLESIEQLPPLTGVYYFYNDEDTLIYIGKSKNIKSRVKQHLKNSSSVKAINLKKDIAKIKYTLTGNELIALLKESEEIKQHLPKYNRRLRKERSSYGLYSYLDGRGYINFQIEKVSNRNAPPHTLFENKRDATQFLDKLCSNHTLCSHLMGGKTSNGSCFSYQIKQCRGACVGEESPTDYNSRANQVIGKLDYSTHSFFIIERGRTTNEISLVAIKNGSYIGYGYIKPSKNLATSDWLKAIELKKENKDAKQIIQSYLNKNKVPNLRKF